MKTTRILIVEDDQKIAEVLKEYLEKEQFHVSILNTGDTVVSQVRAAPPDLILLDIGLPGKDGMTICSEIRTFSKVPIIFVTARVEDVDHLLGLDIGADEYICKPFVPSEVVTHVKAFVVGS